MNDAQANKFVMKQSEKERAVIQQGHENYSGLITIRDDIHKLPWMVIRTREDRVSHLADIIAKGIEGSSQAPLHDRNTGVIGLTYIPTSKGFTVEYSMGDQPKSEELLQEWLTWWDEWHDSADPTKVDDPDVYGTRNFLNSR